MHELHEKYWNHIDELKIEDLENLAHKIDADYQAGKIMPNTYDDLMKALYSKKYGCDASYRDTKTVEKTTERLVKRGFKPVTTEDRQDSTRIIYCRD